jgi:hypothetical protein
MAIASSLPIRTASCGAPKVDTVIRKLSPAFFGASTLMKTLRFQPTLVLAASHTDKLKKNQIMNIPLLDLKAQYATIKAEVTAAISDVLESQHFILGPKVFPRNWSVVGQRRPAGLPDGRKYRAG